MLRTLQVAFPLSEETICLCRLSSNSMDLFFYTLDGTKCNHLRNTADQLSNPPSVVPLRQVLWICLYFTVFHNLSTYAVVFPVDAITTKEAGVAEGS